MCIAFPSRGRSSRSPLSTIVILLELLLRQQSAVPRPCATFTNGFPRLGAMADAEMRMEVSWSGYVLRRYLYSTSACCLLCATSDTTSQPSPASDAANTRRAVCCSFIESARQFSADHALLCLVLVDVLTVAC